MAVNMQKSDQGPQQAVSAGASPFPAGGGASWRTGRGTVAAQANLGKGILDKILQYFLVNGKEFRAPSFGFTMTLNRTRFYIPV